KRLTWRGTPAPRLLEQRHSSTAAGEARGWMYRWLRFSTSPWRLTTRTGVRSVRLACLSISQDRDRLRPDPEALATFKITIAYDGTEFVGWQRQSTGASIQGVVEDAARALDERDVTVTGAGRTDAGVHALGQVASFTLNRAIAPDALVRALNARLPRDVRVLEA